MRLLKLEPEDGFSLVEFFGDNIPPYSILSHTWGAASEEVTFKDLIEGTGKEKPGYRKLLYCREQTATDGLQYFWVDTCCIDKTSSAELSEAINSMWRWYEHSRLCYAYLIDVPEDTDLEGDDTAFTRSKWFTRGWTLQELLAPEQVVLFSNAWRMIGTKSNLAEKISTITGIHTRYLLHKMGPHNNRNSRKLLMERASIAERMSWASSRKTTREEDVAYSLLGIFDISMPLLYGEGYKAFRRLQEEIMKHSADQSLFAWGGSFLPGFWWEGGNILAYSPAAFYGCGNIIRNRNSAGAKPYFMTNRGLQIEFPLLKVSRGNRIYARLNCRYEHDILSDLAICIRQDVRTGQYSRFDRTIESIPVTEWRSARIHSMHFRVVSKPSVVEEAFTSDSTCVIRDLPRGFTISRAFPIIAWSPASKEIRLERPLPWDPPRRPVFVYVTSSAYRQYLFVLFYQKGKASNSSIPEIRLIPSSMYENDDIQSLYLRFMSEDMPALPKAEICDTGGVVYPRVTRLIARGETLIVLDIIITSKAHVLLLEASKKMTRCSRRNILAKKSADRVSM